MSKSFTKPPIEDKIIGDDGYLSQVWREWFTDTWQSMDELANEAGVQIPQITELQRVGTVGPPAVAPIINTESVNEGFLVYQTDGAAGFYYWDGASWQTLP